MRARGEICDADQVVVQVVVFVMGGLDLDWD